MPLTPRPGPRARSLLSAGLLLAVLAACRFPCAAQTGSAVRTFYAPRFTFVIPFVMDPGDHRVREVQLYATEEQQPGNWQQAGVAHPGDRGFNFTATHDGWYLFAVRSVTQDNRTYPASVDQLRPDMKVCVDTVPPAVTLRQAASSSEPAAVEWDVRDDHLDLESLRLEYRPVGGGEWQPLSITKGAVGQRAWNPTTNVTLEVRLQVKDLAGNPGEGHTTVVPGAAPRPAGGATADAGPGATNVRMVNSKRISINYELKEVGKSGIAVVELWYTRNEGRSWQKYDEKTTPQSPYVVTVNDEGLYGFTLVAKNRAGGGEPPPKVGDSPQVWVEVDLTKPVVHIGSVDVGRGAEAGTLTINYTATDKNIARQPISLSYAEKPDGPWTPIIQGEENTGRYVWRMPESVPFEFHVRVDAMDRAGNVGRAESAKPVIVDLSQPKVQVIGIDPAANP
jgi:hypothetical protein